MPKTSFTFNASDHALLNELTTRLGKDRTDAIRTAIRDTVARLRKEEPLYTATQPEPSRTPTIAPLLPHRRTQDMVVNQPGARRTPPAKGPANTKRRKK